MDNNNISGILWRRLKYQLSPQLDVYKYIAKHLDPRDNVLEIGFGTGLGTLQLAAKADRVTATEIDPLAVDFASECFPIPNIHWELSDITLRASGSYNAVVCLEVLEHVPDWDGALKNIRRVCSGKLYISGPNANADLRKNDKHEREWTAGEFHSALKEYFDSVELYDYTLSEKQGLFTHVTPILAVCSNA